MGRKLICTRNTNRVLCRSSRTLVHTSTPPSLRVQFYNVFVALVTQNWWQCEQINAYANVFKCVIKQNTSVSPIPSLRVQFYICSINMHFMYKSCGLQICSFTSTALTKYNWNPSPYSFLVVEHCFLAARETENTWHVNTGQPSLTQHLREMVSIRVVAQECQPRPQALLRVIWLHNP